MTGEVFDVDGDRKLGSGFGPDARHRQEASVGIVALEQGGDLRRDRLDLRGTVKILSQIDLAVSGPVLF